MLLEVLVSAVLVALIAVGTYTGLVSAGRATARERGSAQGLVIAQQDEERLRGLNITQLVQLGEKTYSVAENGLCVKENSGGWYYYSGATEWKSGCEAIKGFEGTKYTGAVYTITSEAIYVSAKETATCESGEADYIRTTSTVTWTSIGSHEPVKQSSLVNEPSTAMLMVKVKNRNNEPVSGATVEAFDPTSSATATVTETTPSSGCVVFGALEEGEVKLLASKGEWVTHNGKAAPEKITSVKKGSLAEAEFTLEAPGTIEAKFFNKPQTTTQYVTGFTFVAFQSEAASAAPFFVGGAANSPSSTATLSQLFPFALPVNQPDKYTAYAGDCEANNPATVTGNTVPAPTVQVEPSPLISHAEVEEPEVKTTVYEGTSTKAGNKLNSTSAKIINSECKGKTAQTTVPYEHEDPIVSGSLEYPYLPYAKTYELCVVGKVESTYYEYKKSLSSYTNTSKAGTTWPTIYLKGEYTTKSSSPISC